MSRGGHVQADPDYVRPISVKELAEAALPGQPMHCSTRRLLDKELERLRQRRAARGLVPPAEDNLTGIALSGGGIRSATFALGVLQALARDDLLKRFDYLSTVSGGGYIGSSLSWWWSEKSGPKDGVGQANAFGTGPDDFPYGTDSPSIWRGRVGTAIGPRLLANLRKHGNYLTPGGGINVLSGISVVLRAVILNLIVWLPLVTLLLLALIAGTAGIWQPADEVSGAVRAAAAAQAEGSRSTIFLLLIDGLVLAGLFTLLAVLYEVANGRLERSGAGEAPRWASLIQGLVEVPDWRIWAPITLAILFGLLLILPPNPSAWHGLGLFLLAGGILATTFGLLSVIYALSTGLREWIGRRTETAELLRRLGYRMRRLFETWARFYLSIIGALVLVGALSFIAGWLMRPSLDGGILAPGQETGGGTIALIAGLFAAGLAFLRSGARVAERLRARGFQVSGGFTAMIAAALLLFGVLLIAHDAADRVYDRWPELAPAFLAALVVAIASALIVNINHISLGRFYRDRLMEAFMPGFEQAKACRTGRAPREADEMKLGDASPAAPYHIINTNVVLIGAKERRRCIRGGDNFILTPDHCGSSATGWCPTERFMDDGMTLATAMAISGAAANPNTGVGGVGLARSRVVSVLMALLNLRLGYWVPHPARCEGGVPNHFHPASSALLFGYRESYPWQELTDGGHFENLGIYELIRRRARLILVADGGQDPGFQFEDLQTALRRIGEDFGASIDFYGSHPMEDLIPAGGEHGYPRGLELAKRGFAVARICYPPDFESSGRVEPEDASSASTLIYLTTTMVDGLPLELRGYKGKNPEFPDQSTGDQFFDEDQFEAYRELGYRIAETMIERLGLKDTLEALQPEASPTSDAKRAA